MSAVPATAAARAFVRALLEAGVRDVCITPGSRSTPLTVAFAEQPAARPWLHLDERSAAFFALGLARECGAPVALVCTSGTAAANYYPAVVEANLSRIPLIVCTADRPPRLRGAGAEQTIAQVGMFGENARWAVDLPVPVGVAGEERAFVAAAGRAVRTSRGPLPGPVHMNLPFEEPLIESSAGRTAAISASPGRFGAPAEVPPAAAELARAAAALVSARRPLVVAGPETGGLPPAAIAVLAATLGAPLLADPLSGLRTGPHDRSHIIDTYDALLRDPRAAALQPDAVVRFGAVPTSKALNQFLAAAPDAVHILCDAPGSLRDPSALTTHVVTGDAALAAESLVRLSGGRRAAGGWLDSWRRADGRARDAMQLTTARFEEAFEGRIFTELQNVLPAGATIVAGNSMPVRDLDAFVVSGAKPLHFVSNRGANGIDGVVSSALGAAAVADGPVVLVIGDLSFYHDMNGLWAARRHALDLTVVLVNNNGGGIFHYLPQAAHSDVFEAWFGTPVDIDFAPAVRMYGGEYTLARDWEAFRVALRPASGLRVIEVRTDRARNAAMHREAWAAAAQAAWEPRPVALP